ncbi:MAG: ROK family protein [Bacteroidales bacterium]
MFNKKKHLLVNKESIGKTLEQLMSLIHSVFAPEVKGIGIGVPSVVDIQKGIVYNVTHIPSWTKVELKDILESEFNVPVYVNNDVNCFILGEYLFGSAKGYDPVVGLAVGTGLGSGIINEGRLFIGANCGAGEVGPIPYLGKTLEYYCSGNFFNAFYQTSALEMAEKAFKGDPSAINAWHDFGNHFGNAIKIVAYAYDPKAIIIGGSISKAYSLFEKSMMASLKDYEFPESIKKLKIMVTSNPDITILGAASLVP